MASRPPVLATGTYVAVSPASVRLVLAVMTVPVIAAGVEPPIAPGLGSEDVELPSATDAPAIVIDEFASSAFVREPDGNVCVAVYVFALPRLMSSVVLVELPPTLRELFGDVIVSPLPPDPQAEPVPLTTPDVLTVRHWVDPVIDDRVTVLDADRVVNAPVDGVVPPIGPGDGNAVVDEPRGTDVPAIVIVELAKPAFVSAPLIAY